MSELPPPADTPPPPSDWKCCPRCGSVLTWDEVDNGVGIERGNPGCEDCHWMPGEPDVMLDAGILKALAAGAILQKQHVAIAVLLPEANGRREVGFAANLIRELATRLVATLAAAQAHKETLAKIQRRCEDPETCPHDLAERDTMVADGYCPACLVAELAQVRVAAQGTARQLQQRENECDERCRNEERLEAAYAALREAVQDLVTKWRASARTAPEMNIMNRCAHELDAALRAALQGTGPTT